MESVIGVLLVLGACALCSVPFSLLLLWMARIDYESHRIDKATYNLCGYWVWIMAFLPALTIGFAPFSTAVAARLS